MRHLSDFSLHTRGFSRVEDVEIKHLNCSLKFSAFKTILQRNGRWWAVRNSFLLLPEPVSSSSSHVEWPSKIHVLTISPTSIDHMISILFIAILSFISHRVPNAWRLIEKNVRKSSDKRFCFLYVPLRLFAVLLAKIIWLMTLHIPLLDAARMAQH